MLINRVEFMNLIENNFENNFHKCAYELCVDVSTISRVVNAKKNAGTKLLGNLMVYCRENGLNFDKFIFLPKTLRRSNAC